MSSPNFSQDIDEIHRTQQLLIDSLDQDQCHYPDDKSIQVDKVLNRARDYHGKLVNIGKSLVLLNERMASMKKKANKMLQVKEKADLELQRIKERQELLEKHLEPVVKTNINH